MTVALAELAMQRIVIPRGEILYAGSSPVGHQFAIYKNFWYNIYVRWKKKYPISLMERASDYESQDTGSTPVWGNWSNLHFLLHMLSRVIKWLVRSRLTIPDIERNRWFRWSKTLESLSFRERTQALISRSSINWKIRGFIRRGLRVQVSPHLPSLMDR